MPSQYKFEIIIAKFKNAHKYKSKRFRLSLILCDNLGSWGVGSWITTMNFRVFTSCLSFSDFHLTCSLAYSSVTLVTLKTAFRV